MATIRTNGVETYYERRGDGPTVVFVHASMLDHSVWDEQVDALSGDYETIAYDLRGHGRTGRSAASRSARWCRRSDSSDSNASNERTSG